MDKHDRDELDRHISGDIELSEQDAADLALLEDTQPTEHATREIAAELTAYTHPVEALQMRETWLQGSASDGKGGAYIFRVDSGAGIGHAELSLLVEHETPGATPDDAPVTERLAFEYIDMTTLTESWVESVIARAEAKRAQRDALSARESDEGTI